MHFNVPFTKDDIKRAVKVPVTQHMLADAAFESIRAICIFQKVSLTPLLQGLLNRSPREQAIVGFYYRIVAYLTSLYKLNDPIHFQTIAASARSLFELGLDMALFSKDSTDESLNRLNAFTRVERYRVAKKLVDFCSTKTLPPDQDISVQRSLCAEPKEKIEVEALVQKYWGHNNSPKHWSPFQEARGRARHVGSTWEEWYVQYYYMLSWHIHPGTTGVAGLPKEAFDYFAWEAFQLSTDVAIESYRILGRELHITEAMPTWLDSLAFLDRVYNWAFVDKCLQSLGEPSRFQYLEEHEKDVA